MSYMIEIHHHSHFLHMEFCMKFSNCRTTLLVAFVYCQFGEHWNGVSEGHEDMYIIKCDPARTTTDVQ